MTPRAGVRTRGFLQTAPRSRSRGAGTLMDVTSGVLDGYVESRLAATAEGRARRVVTAGLGWSTEDHVVLRAALGCYADHLVASCLQFIPRDSRDERLQRDAVTRLWASWRLYLGTRVYN